MAADRDIIDTVIAHTRWLEQRRRGTTPAAGDDTPAVITHHGVQYFRGDLVTRVTDEILQRERLAVRMACEVLRDAGAPATSQTCSGCDVSVGQRHWDNCPLVPAFSQPVFTGA